MAIDRDLRIGIKVSGMGSGLMFDRYPGNNQTTLTAEEKMYFVPGTRQLCMPSVNLQSFLSAQNTPSAPKRLFDTRKYKKIANAMASFVVIEEDHILITRGGTPIVFNRFNNSGIDPDSNVVKHQAVARLEKGVPNPKERPLLLNDPAPWEMEFHLQVLRNEDLAIDDFRRVFSVGGVAVGFGTYRPQFGKFKLDRFDVDQLGE